MSDLTRIVQNLLDEYDGNWDEAVSRFSDMLETDSEMFDEYVRPMVRDFARNKIYSLGHVRRSNMFENAGKPKSNKKTEHEEPKFVSEVGFGAKGSSNKQEKGRSGEEDHKGIVGDLAIVEDNIQRYLDDYWLNNCKKKLGDADKADLDMEYEESMRHAKGNYERALWYAEIRDGLPEDSIVREKFSSDDIEALIVKVKQNVSNQLEDRELKSA